MTEEADLRLEVRDLSVVFGRGANAVRAVSDVDLEVAAGEVLGLVGESGCGKTVTGLSIMRLLPPAAKVEQGAIRFGGRDILRFDRRAIRRLRGGAISMVLQDPLTSLHPAFTIGAQVAEALLAHQPRMTRRAARDRAVDLLAMVGIAEPHRRAGDRPHQWSGGMRQRAMIAMAIANRPSLLIADEPTTALDVTIQAQILDLLRSVRQETGASLLLITHDLGVVAELCDRVAVMSAGRVVEAGSVHDIFHRPQHPHTARLLAAVPRIEAPARHFRGQGTHVPSRCGAGG